LNLPTIPYERIIEEPYASTVVTQNRPLKCKRIQELKQLGVEALEFGENLAANVPV
jgi:hypothetical protein